MLKFSPANSKLAKLYKAPELAQYLTNKRKIYSLDLLAGHTCPHAKDCFSKVEVVGDKLKVVDGPDTQFRCYAASLEVVYQAVYRQHKYNTDIMRGCKTTAKMEKAIAAGLPKNAGVVRIHSSGDFFSQLYFNAWLRTAKKNPHILFYAYTKALPFWQKQKAEIPENFILTASRGGKKDSLIDKNGFREVTVVFSEVEAEDMGLELDQNDLSAANPKTYNVDFALLLHGVQPAKTRASAALSKIKRGVL